MRKEGKAGSGARTSPRVSRRQYVSKGSCWPPQPARAAPVPPFGSKTLLQSSAPPANCPLLTTISCRIAPTTSWSQMKTNGLAAPRIEADADIAVDVLQVERHRLLVVIAAVLAASLVPLTELLRRRGWSRGMAALAAITSGAVAVGAILFAGVHGFF